MGTRLRRFREEVAITGFGVPGKAYFETFRQALASHIGEDNPAFVFTYPTYVDYEVAGDFLAERLRVLQNDEDFGGIVLIGHSMGGLVARQAAGDLEDDPAYEGLTRGIITLGTPHLGTPPSATGGRRLLWGNQVAPMSGYSPNSSRVILQRAAGGHPQDRDSRSE